MPHNVPMLVHYVDISDCDTEFFRQTFDADLLWHERSALYETRNIAFFQVALKPNPQVIEFENNGISYLRFT